MFSEHAARPASHASNNGFMDSNFLGMDQKKSETPSLADGEMAAFYGTNMGRIACHIFGKKFLHFCPFFSCAVIHVKKILVTKTQISNGGWWA